MTMIDREMVMLHSDLKKNLRGAPGNYTKKTFSMGAIGLETPCTRMPVILPPLRPWSQNAQSRCAYDEIAAIWEAYDVVTFIADLGIYHPSLLTILDRQEQEREQAFKTEYFRERFTVSRSIIRQVLQPIVGSKTPSDVLLGKEKKGRVMVHDAPEICISLSYSGTSIAVTLGKQKIGSDIEVVRPLDIQKTRSCPLFDDTMFTTRRERTRHFLQLWTMIESYAKLYDKNPYPLLNTSSLFQDATFVSYSINHHAIFSLASGQEQFTDTLVWLDTSGT